MAKNNKTLLENDLVQQEVAKNAPFKRDRQGITFTQPSLAKQSFAQEVNINKIMDRYQSTGQLPTINKQTASYLNNTGQTFRESMQVVVDGRNAFNKLPSKTRRRFGEDPAQFIEFLQDSRNHDEAVALGLVEPIETPIAIEPPAKPETPVETDP